MRCGICSVFCVNSAPNQNRTPFMRKEAGVYVNPQNMVRCAESDRIGVNTHAIRF
ncbi:unnamed protein product [Staurois parvus]|uniref:Uncharacterized protein n=1 Tax=Staurois parvus TaxID=386267 RepID=A0ABN9CE29_9NEOB|nr:unnamed protein product [Staurois parvus]